MQIYLESIDLEKNRRRWYMVTTGPGLFGQTVVREWGRIGSRGRRIIETVPDPEARAAEIVESKIRRGYECLPA